MDLRKILKPITTQCLPGCNIDSNAMPNNTQDSVHGSKRDINGDTPPITFNKKIDDRIGAFLETTSTSKPRKRWNLNTLQHVNAVCFLK